MTNNNLIGIISDSHDHKENISRAVDIFNNAGCGLVVHAGDFVAPFTAREFKRLSCPFIGVFGNNDGEHAGLLAQFSSFGSINRAPYEFEHAGRRLVVMHEPFYLEEYRKKTGIDVIIYGHIHRIVIEQGPPLVINPGESCSWLTGRSTVVLLDTVTLEAQTVDIE